jgi:crotonobetainyl-CoA:carnitine CoA-transferase CaiB-like acyl-CoA transferase
VGWNDLSAHNPRLIYCAITGFGPGGPYQHRPAYDTVIQAISGLLGQFLAPEAPRIAGPNVADSVTGLYASYAVLGALFDRERTGRGHLVEVPMLEAVIAFATGPFGQFFQNGTTPGPYLRPAQSQCFVFRCADNKMVAIHLSAPVKFWEALLKAVERPELSQDPRFNCTAARIENYEDLSQALGRSFTNKKRAEWMSILDDLDVPFAPVNDFAEVAADPQVRHLGTFIEMQHPRMGNVKGITRPIFYDGGRQMDMAPPPVLGEHTERVLTEGGFTMPEIRELREGGVIGA